MILHMSGLGGSDDENGARRVQRVGTDPRKSEVVRTSRFDAEDAEFGQEAPEELSAVLTAYHGQWFGTRVGLKDREHTMGARRAANNVPSGEAWRPTTHGRGIHARSSIQGDA
jgi:hypothetical protein